MPYIDISPDHVTVLYWLIAGCIFLLLEAFGASGVGFLFAGLASISVGGLVAFDIIATDPLINQITFFFILVVGWFVLLWVPLKRMTKKSSKSFSNMIGEQVVVMSTNVNKIAVGQVKWSGSVFNARLTEDCPVNMLQKGAYGTIKQVKGSTLLISTE